MERERKREREWVGVEKERGWGRDRLNEGVFRRMYRDPVMYREYALYEI